MTTFQVKNIIGTILNNTSFSRSQILISSLRKKSFMYIYFHTVEEERTTSHLKSRLNYRKCSSTFVVCVKNTHKLSKVLKNLYDFLRKLQT